MSHVVEVQLEIKDRATLDSALDERTDVEWIREGEFKLYSGRVRGLGVKLESWKYPIVFDFETGAVKYDNYNGSWGKQEKFDELRQSYATHKTVREAQRLGHRVLSRTTLANGSIKVVLQGGLR